jgi:hypothetical protein
MNPEEIPTDKLEEIEKAEREERRAANEQEARKRVKRYELKKAAMAKLGGNEGEAFALVDTPRGIVVLKKGAGVLYKKLKKSKVEEADVDDFIQAHFVGVDTVETRNVDALVDIMNEWGGVIDELLAACVKLHGVDLQNKGKK